MWRLEFSDGFLRAARKLDRGVLAQIRQYLLDIVALPDPSARGKPLTANRRGYWRYRVGDYRVICEIRRDQLIVIAVTVAHRSEIYR